MTDPAVVTTLLNTAGAVAGFAVGYLLGGIRCTHPNRRDRP